MRLFIFFSYDGTRYHGWQSQPNGITVQQELERCLGTLLRRAVSVTGAGRTDTGVHARRMAAHFDSAEAVDCAQLAYRLNRILPPDIAVQAVCPVAADMHARFSARARTYHYYVCTRKDPFSRQYACRLGYPLDFAAMNLAAAHLLSVEDFAAFCKSHTDVRTTICHVWEARWVQDGPGAWHFRIRANRFLRNMVRAVVGTLIEVGRGRMTQDEFRAVVASHSRCAAGESMPACALFLEDVEYPDLDPKDTR